MYNYTDNSTRKKVITWHMNNLSPPQIMNDDDEAVTLVLDQYSVAVCIENQPFALYANDKSSLPAFIKWLSSGWHRETNKMKHGHRQYLVAMLAEVTRLNNLTPLSQFFTNFCSHKNNRQAEYSLFCLSIYLYLFKIKKYTGFIKKHNLISKRFHW